jgi:hypothetical protein
MATKTRKTINEVIAELKAIGFKVNSRESSAARSKFWLRWPEGATKTKKSDMMLSAYGIAERAGRHVQLEVQTEWLDDFSGLFVGFAKNEKAAEMIDAGIDPEDLM